VIELKDFSRKSLFTFSKDSSTNVFSNPEGKSILFSEHPTGKKQPISLHKVDLAQDTIAVAFVIPAPDEDFEVPDNFK